MAALLTQSLSLRIISAFAMMPVVLGIIIYGSYPFLIMIHLAFMLAAYEWLMMARHTRSTFINCTLGIVYFLIAFACFYYIRTHDAQGAALTLCLILSVWASDTGAYFAGKMIGGAKLAPSISPNKTWAGLVGGMICSALAAMTYGMIDNPVSSFVNLDLVLPSALSAIDLFILGAIITFAGQAGDLLISIEKRKVGVKDTGALIPGHGGLLDRIDSLLFAAPVFLILLKVFM